MTLFGHHGTPPSSETPLYSDFPRPESGVGDVRTRQQVSLRIVVALGRRLVQAETDLEELAFKGIPARLALLYTRIKLFYHD
jgi:hypothetical protein